MLFLTLSCSSQQTNNKAEINKQSLPANTVDFEKTTPQKFLELLKISDKKNKVLYFFKKAPVGWVKKEDIDLLIPLIKSNDTCKCLIAIFSSYAPFGNYSTIGGQVIDMIDSYREKKSFAVNQNYCSKVDMGKVKEIEKWWNEYRKDK